MLPPNLLKAHDLLVDTQLTRSRCAVNCAVNAPGPNLPGIPRMNGGVVSSQPVRVRIFAICGIVSLVFLAECGADMNQPLNTTDSNPTPTITAISSKTSGCATVPAEASPGTYS